MSMRSRFIALVAIVVWLAALAGEACAALNLAPAAIAISAGGSATVQVSGATGGVTAESNNGAIATVDVGNAGAGGATLTIKGMRAGRASVAVRDGARARLDVPVTVMPAMVVTPGEISLPVGSSTRITPVNVRARRLVASSANAGVATATASGNAVLVTAIAPGSTVVTAQDGASTAEVRVTVVGSVAGEFGGTLLLGSPTSNSVVISILSPEHSGHATIAWGAVSGNLEHQTAPIAVTRGTPLPLRLSGLAADTRYHYRLAFLSDDGSGSGTTPEHAFHTARAPGSTFTFTIQADPHLDENSDLDVYRRTLDNALADGPDFHIDMGDTFMCEKHCTPFTATLQAPQDLATVEARYAYERGNFGRISHSTPLYLVNGNHDGELGWLADGTASNLAIWATLARHKYFANPVPDSFYGGDATSEPFVGQRASWYSWHWGDALFVVLDPYWNTKLRTNSDSWNMTLGARQYAWLESTLASSRARFKFVFIHNLVGGLDGQMRGGIEAAPYYEWGGQNADGTPGFATRRPGWSMPIHSLLVRHGVSAVFHGHDHVYVKQVLDGIVYQELPQPSARSYSSGPNLATTYHYASGTIRSSPGHVRVTVSPEQATVEYVRAWLPKDETSQRQNGQVDDRWTIPAVLTAP